MVHPVLASALAAVVPIISYILGRRAGEADAAARLARRVPEAAAAGVLNNDPTALRIALAPARAAADAARAEAFAGLRRALGNLTLSLPPASPAREHHDADELSDSDPPGHAAFVARDADHYARADYQGFPWDLRFDPEAVHDGLCSPAHPAHPIPPPSATLPNYSRHPSSSVRAAYAQAENILDRADTVEAAADRCVLSALDIADQGGFDAMISSPGPATPAVVSRVTAAPPAAAAAPPAAALGPDPTIEAMLAAMPPPPLSVAAQLAQTAARRDAARAAKRARDSPSPSRKTLRRRSQRKRRRRGSSDPEGDALDARVRSLRQRSSSPSAAGPALA